MQTSRGKIIAEIHHEDGTIEKLNRRQLTAKEKREFMDWFNKPWPNVDISNDDELAEFAWRWLLEFRDKTEDGARFGYYIASRNKVVAQTIEALATLIKKHSAPPKQEVDKR